MRFLLIISIQENYGIEMRENIDEIFSHSVACDIVNRSEDPEPRSVTEYQNRHDWTK